jgi:hypothetical protein
MRRMIWTTALSAICVSASLGVGEQPAVSSPTSATTPTVTVTPDLRHLGPSVPSDFVGFSAETANTCALVSLAAASPAFAQLLSNLGPGVLRVGGNTVEDSTWNPSSSSVDDCAWNDTTVTPALVDATFAIARKVDWKVVWTLPLATPDPSQTTAEADYVAGQGPTLQSIEFGNEPNLYPNTTFAQVVANWDSEERSFRETNSTTPISGPALAYAYTTYLQDFLPDDASNITSLTVHKYYGKASETDPKTTRELLSPATINSASRTLSAIVRTGASYGLPVTVNETSSYVGFGQSGVSDAFASALWGADYLFTGLTVGVQGMYFHGVPNNASGNNLGQPEYFSPLKPDGTPAPLYYGMLLFHYATEDGGSVVPLTLTSDENVSAHAILGTDKALRVVIINKSSTAVSATVSVPNYSAGTLLSLRAPTLSSTNHVTFGGRAVNKATGVWTPNPADETPVSVTDGSSVFTVPSRTAVVVTFHQ